MVNQSRLVDTVVELAEKALDDPQNEPVPLGEGGYANRVYVGMLVLREATTATYEETIERVETSPLIQATLGLNGNRAGPPAASTLCTAAERLTAAFWRTLLAITTVLFSLSGICAIDASGFDRSAASRRYERRTEYTLRSLKTTLLIDVETLAIIDVHWHDRETA